MKWKYYLLLAAALCVIALGWAFHQVVVQPFGYVAMTHVDNVSDFNAPPKVLSRRYAMTFARTESAWAGELRRLPFLERVRRAVEITRQLQAHSTSKGRPRTSSELF